MFNSDDRTFLFIGILGAIFIAVAANKTMPVTDRAIPVDIAALPLLPATVAAVGAPNQTDVADITVDLGDGYHAQLLHGYVLEGLVVTRREFRHDAAAEISPIDLGITWGDLSDPERADDFDFRAGPRMVSYRPEEDAVLVGDWEAQITNNHLIPASVAVRDALLDIEIGQTVRIRGYLVVATGDRLAPWRSSTRRNDNTIVGGCEIILVRDVEVLPAEPGPDTATKV